jgi:hypothetical protein
LKRDESIYFKGYRMLLQQKVKLNNISIWLNEKYPKDEDEADAEAEAAADKEPIETADESNEKEEENVD